MSMCWGVQRLRSARPKGTLWAGLICAATPCSVASTQEILFSDTLGLLLHAALLVHTPTARFYRTLFSEI